jgi:EcsC protein family
MASVNGTGSLSKYGFRKVYESINRHGIKKGVDEMGLDRFIEHCARLAASTGAITGFGGPVTMILGVPADLLNNVTQQFRVTMAIIYQRKGHYNISFEQLMGVVALSLGVEAGASITKAALARVAEKLLIRLGEKAAARMIPIAGAVVGGLTNYVFIKGIGKTVKRLY